MNEAKVVVITGSSAGFGEVIARIAALAGHIAYATMRDVQGRNAGAAEQLRAWGREKKVEIRVVEMDVASTPSVDAAIQEILAEAGSIDVVVNNAGIAAGGPIEAFDIEQMQQLFDVNVFGPMRVDKAVLPQMRERGSGLLIHITSTLGRVLPRSGGLYPASKWAAEGLAESLHYQVTPFGIDLVILEPGSFPTTASVRGLKPAREDIVAQYAAQSPPPAARAEPDESYRYPDLQEIGDEVTRLINLEPGTRPLRTVVGPVFTEGVAEYNEHYERVRDHLRSVLQRPDQASPWTRGPRK